MGVLEEGGERDHLTPSWGQRDSAGEVCNLAASSCAGTTRVADAAVVVPCLSEHVIRENPGLSWGKDHSTLSVEKKRG